MPQGLQIFDSAGNVVVDVTTRLTRYIATATIAYNDFSVHSFSNPGFLTGTPFFLIDNQNLEQYAPNSVLDFYLTTGGMFSWVNVTISGTSATYQQIMTTAAGANISYQAKERDDIIVHFGVY